MIFGSQADVGFFGFTFLVYSKCGIEARDSFFVEKGKTNKINIIYIQLRFTEIYITQFHNKKRLKIG
jgi:hypothetical protein